MNLLRSNSCYSHAEKNRFKEHNAAIKIVAVWRGHRVRRGVRTQRLVVKLKVYG